MCIVLYVQLIWCSGMHGISAQLEGGQSAMGICALFYIYIYISAITCAKFGVAVFNASMLDWRGVHLLWVYMHCAIYMKPIWCKGFAEIYT